MTYDSDTLHSLLRYAHWLEDQLKAEVEKDGVSMFCASCARSDFDDMNDLMEKTLIDPPLVTMYAGWCDTCNDDHTIDDVIAIITEDPS